MKLAAVDIGSNAIRLQITKVYDHDNMISFKKLQFLRFPLRLGYDVFQNNRISKQTADRFEKLMKTFKLLIDLYEVESYKAVATSAMREAENGRELCDRVRDLVGLKIDIVAGEVEASILNKSILPYLNSNQYVHIDVGGGSTELNVFRKKRLVSSESFKIGSVRSLTDAARKKVFKKMKLWLQEANLNTNEAITGIGTGGNINKLYKLAMKAQGNTISLSELRALRAYAAAFSYEERISILKMNPDRADVIVPASEIYISVLETVGSDQIMVPKVGLKDGLVYELYEALSKKDMSQIEFLEEL